MAASEQSNVININGTEHNLNDLSPKAQYLVAQLQDLTGKMENLQFQLDQVSVARNFFLQELQTEMEGGEESGVQTLEQAQAAANG